MTRLGNRIAVTPVSRSKKLDGSGQKGGAPVARYANAVPKRTKSRPRLRRRRLRPSKQEILTAVRPPRNLLARSLERPLAHPALISSQLSGTRNRRKIALFQNQPVVDLVSGSDEGQRAHGYFLLARDPPPQPGFFLKRAKQRHARVAHQTEFLRKVRKSPLAKCSIPHEIFLFESRQRRLIPPRDAQRPVGKNTLGIRNVPEDFFHRPLPGRIAKTSVSFAPSREQLQHLQPL